MLRTQIQLPMDAIRSICERYRVRELAVFGSVLGDDFRPDSDVDFLVTFQPDARIGLLDLIGMQDELAAAIGRKVDLVPKGGLKPRIRDHVLSQAEVIYGA